MKVSCMSDTLNEREENKCQGTNGSVGFYFINSEKSRNVVKIIQKIECVIFCLKLQRKPEEDVKS